jgi:hypothetical protein
MNQIFFPGKKFSKPFRKLVSVLSILSVSIAKSFSDQLLQEGSLSLDESGKELYFQKKKEITQKTREIKKNKREKSKK